MLRRILDSPWPYFALAAVLAAVAAWTQLRPHASSAVPTGSVAELAKLRERGDVNVIFVLVDALRADRMSVYGAERPTTPHLAKLASEGIRFAHVHAQSSWTKTSMASMLTSTTPHANRILRWEDTMPPAATLPAEIFKGAGYRTAGIFRNDWMSESFGLAKGFDVYHVPHTLKGGPRMRRADPTAPNLLPGTDYDVTEAALAFLRAFGRDGRFFLYLHYMDVHQYASDTDAPTFGTTRLDSYDSAIEWVDRNLGRLTDELERLDLRRRTMVVVVADHGEEFYEHGQDAHGRTLHRESVDTPWILIPPFRLPKGVVVDAPVGNLDVFPTVLDLVGLPPLPGAEGRALLPLIEAAANGTPPPPDLADRAIPADLDLTWGVRGDPPSLIASVTTSTHRMIRSLDDPSWIELYDLAADPLEQNNLAESDPKTRDRLAAALDAHLAAPPVAWGAPPPVEMDRMRLEQLRALGYVVH